MKWNISLSTIVILNIMPTFSNSCARQKCGLQLPELSELPYLLRNSGSLKPDTWKIPKLTKAKPNSNKSSNIVRCTLTNSADALSHKISQILSVTDLGTDLGAALFIPVPIPLSRVTMFASIFSSIPICPPSSSSPPQFFKLHNFSK